MATPHKKQPKKKQEPEKTTAQSGTWQNPHSKQAAAERLAHRTWLLTHDYPPPTYHWYDIWQAQQQVKWTEKGSNSNMIHINKAIIEDGDYHYNNFDLDLDKEN